MKVQVRYKYQAFIKIAIEAISSLKYDKKEKDQLERFLFRKSHKILYNLIEEILDNESAKLFEKRLQKKKINTENKKKALIEALEIQLKDLKNKSINSPRTDPAIFTEKSVRLVLTNPPRQ